MKIHKLTASFGKLNHDTIEFNDGLNVVYAPNESGKSTWCAFIRAMLYGVDSAERAKTGYLPDKIKYAPWSGAPMEGTMELTSGEKHHPHPADQNKIRPHAGIISRVYRHKHLRSGT